MYRHIKVFNNTIRKKKIEWKGAGGFNPNSIIFVNIYVCIHVSYCEFDSSKPISMGTGANRLGQFGLGLLLLIHHVHST